MSKKGKYRYLHYMYEKGFDKITVDCEVIKETAKSYQIKLLADNVRGHKYGDIIWVSKDKVDLPKEPRDCSEEWWNRD